jgi:hypothetical protein
MLCKSFVRRSLKINDVINDLQMTKHLLLFVNFASTMVKASKRSHDEPSTAPAAPAVTVLCTEIPDYGSSNYWDARYHNKEDEGHEWYVVSSSLVSAQRLVTP